MMVLHEHQSLANGVVLSIWAGVYLVLTRYTARQRRENGRPARRSASTTGTMRVRP